MDLIGKPSMTSRLTILAGAALLAAAAALPAQAAILTFDLSGSRNATFQIDSNATPTTFSSSVFGDQIRFDDVAGTFGGVAGTASIGFGTDVFADLNINGTGLGFTQFAGADLFSGPASAPIFATGTFTLPSIVSGTSTLTISEAAPGGPSAGGVPEPATWALMIGGFGLTGAALRKRRQAMTLVRA